MPSTNDAEKLWEERWNLKQLHLRQQLKALSVDLQRRQGEEARLVQDEMAGALREEEKVVRASLVHERNLVASAVIDGQLYLDNDAAGGAGGAAVGGQFHDEGGGGGADLGADNGGAALDASMGLKGSVLTNSSSR